MLRPRVRILSALGAISIFSSIGNAQTGVSLTTSIKEAANAYADAAAGRATAILSFPNLEGRVSLLAGFVSEQLSVDLSTAIGSRGTVVERSQVIQVLKEERLGTLGLTAQDAARVGKKLGARLVIVGTLTVVGSQVLINSRLVSVDSATVVRSFRIEGSAPIELLKLDQQSSENNSAAPSNRPANSTESNNMKEVSTLRAVVTSVQIFTPPSDETCVNSAGDRVFCSSLSQAPPRGMRINLDLTNKDNQKSAYVALNATNERGGAGHNVVFGSGGRFANCGIGLGIRSSIIDSNGNTWKLTNAAGINTVGVGCVNGAGNPADIANALSKQDQLNGAELPMRAQYAYGNTSTVEPGQTLTLSLEYRMVSASNSYGNPSSFQLSCELVIGTANGDRGIAYELKNINFDKLTLQLGRR